MRDLASLFMWDRLPAGHLTGKMRKKPVPHKTGRILIRLESELDPADRAGIIARGIADSLQEYQCQ
jgi:hypothetical protein